MKAVKPGVPAWQLLRVTCRALGTPGAQTYHRVHGSFASVSPRDPSMQPRLRTYRLPGAHTFGAKPSTSERNAAQGFDHLKAEENPGTEDCMGRGSPPWDLRSRQGRDLLRVTLQPEWSWERALLLRELQRPRQFCSRRPWSQVPWPQTACAC